MSAKESKKGKDRPNVRKSRKQIRKEERKNKKLRRHEYYSNRKNSGQFVPNNKNHVPGSTGNQQNTKLESHILVKNKNVKNLEMRTKESREKPQPQTQMLGAEQVRAKEKKQQVKLQQEMNKHRKKQLLEANFEEDRNIKRLEKQLKLNKRKSKSVPASFARDGLDFLLEVCDPENMKNSALIDQHLTDVNDAFEEDLVLMTGESKNKMDGKKDKVAYNSAESDIMDSDSDGASSENTEKIVVGTKVKRDKKHRTYSVDSEDSDDIAFSDLDGEKDLGDLDEVFEEETNRESDADIDTTEVKTNCNKKGSKESRKKISNTIDQEESSEDNNIEKLSKKSKSKKTSSKNDRNDSKKRRMAESDSDGDLSESQSDNSFEDDENKESDEQNDGTWKDIYGRLRAKDGSVVTEKAEKYIPPRARMMSDMSADKARTQKLERLKKQLKGLINKLAESNMHSIATQIEELYMSNSRNDMNSTITNLLVTALVSNILAPERLLMEHVLLIVILHANVGTEVGAHFLQTIIKQFDDYLNNAADVENKRLDNLILILAQLYNFKMFDSKLIYEIIEKLSKVFEEKHVECILHILKNVGFNLRKDNPLALKDLILALQKKASNASEKLKDNSRVKFMLDVLLAIKNNNMTKIPNYDTSYSEHLKKIMKGFIRKGNYVTQLNISLEDLLKAEEKGKWWVVGSAWTGNVPEDDNTKNKNTERTNTFSQKLLELASKQRMNTDTRKNIFCIIMSAEDYLDAFEKLLRLSLKNQQEREIIHVLLHCCLQEKAYNPYYATLVQKFCEYDRKYQMTIKYSIWDKLKALNEHSATQISHLAKLLSHLFLEKGLPISTLKIVQFGELDKVTLRFIRQILLGILLHEDLEVCKAVFDKVSQSDKLKMFKESLRLFLHHFLLRNLESQGIAEHKKKLLQERVKVVEKLLSHKQSRLQY